MAALTTGGSYTFNQSASTLIASSLRLCNVIQEDETPSASQALNALQTLNAMVKGWQGSGIHVWCEEECLLFLQPNQPRYQLGVGSPDNACLVQDFFQGSLATGAAGTGSIVLTSVVGATIGAASLAVGDYIGVQLDAGTNYWTTVSGISGNIVALTSGGIPTVASAGALVFAYGTPLMRPLRVPAGRRYQYSSAQQTPLIVMSRLDYDYLPNPYNTGTITQYFFDPQTGEGAYTNPIGIMNVWPTPQDYTNGMRFVGQRPIQDLSTLASLPDFPAEWLACLKWNLALEIAPEYDVPAERMSVIQAGAKRWWDMASTWDKEPESIMFGVAMQPAYRTG